jgi:DNA-directed RNA polymerase sigma subunit (sigma70/sigma32)
MASDYNHLDSLDRFLHAIGRYPVLTPADEARLAARLAAGDADARQRLIESNLRLVVAVAQNHRNDGVAFLDVIQEGVLGLIAAVDAFDPRAGNGFSSFARWHVERAIRAALADRARRLELVPDGPAPDPGAGSVPAAVEELPERPCHVLELRYGLDGEDGRSYEAIGRELGVCKERVRQVEPRTLHLLCGGLRAAAA